MVARFLSSAAYYRDIAQLALVVALFAGTYFVGESTGWTFGLRKSLPEPTVTPWSPSMAGESEDLVAISN